MMTRAILVTLSCLSCFQSVLAFQLAGSVEDARSLWAWQERQQADLDDWNKSIKLTIVPGKQKGVIGGGGPIADLKFDEVCSVFGTWTTVISVIDDSNCILRIGQNVVWLEKFPTKGLSDNQSVRVLDPVKMTGTKKYESTLGGLKTVKSIRMLNQTEQSVWEAKIRAENLADEELQQKMIADAANKEKEFTDLQKRLAKQERESKAESFELKDKSVIRGQLVDSKNGVVEIRDTDDLLHDNKLIEFTGETVAKIRSLLKKKELQKKIEKDAPKVYGEVSRDPSNQPSE